MFDRNKLINGLLRACANRPISIAAIEKMVDDIEAKLQILSTGRFLHSDWGVCHGGAERGG